MGGILILIIILTLMSVLLLCPAKTKTGASLQFLQMLSWFTGSLNKTASPQKCLSVYRKSNFGSRTFEMGVQTLFSVKSSVTHLAGVLCVVAMFFMLAAHRCLLQPAWVLPGSYFTPLGCRARFKPILCPLPLSGQWGHVTNLPQF